VATSDLLATEKLAERAGLYSTYRLNFDEVRVILANAKNMLEGYTDKDVCIYKYGKDYKRVARKPGVPCLEFLDESSLEATIAGELARIKPLLAPVKNRAPVITLVTGKPEVTMPSSSDAEISELLKLVQKPKQVYYDDEPAVAVQPAQTCPAIANMPARPSPGDELERAQWDACVRAQGGNPDQVERYQAKIVQVIRQTPETITTPQPGTVPVTSQTGLFAQIFSSLAQGATTYQQEILKQKMATAAAQGQPIYVPAGTIPSQTIRLSKPKAAVPGVALGIGALVLVAGAVFFLARRN
jgi:hypothetical protein